ncbi:MAG: hypothetical protein INR71_06960 [Terriglobus roseus]|nr:hypothetical protein [Terriglobus roseus]
MADVPLSVGSLKAIFANDDSAHQGEPILQCVQIKPMDKKDESSPDRWRLVLSDSQNFIQSMLATRTCIVLACIVTTG